jgi:hypothetical protein
MAVAERQYLDGTTFATDGQGLTLPLSWHPGNHFANTAMLRACCMNVRTSVSAGYWRDEPDPKPSQAIKLSCSPSRRW